MKNDSPQFNAEAVALFQRRPEATIRQVAPPGWGSTRNPETLRNWVRRLVRAGPRSRRAEVSTEPPTPLEAENAALGPAGPGAEEEREILRKATKCFAGETRW